MVVLCADRDGGHRAERVDPGYPDAAPARGITWPSSRWASARSSGCWPTTWPMSPTARADLDEVAFHTSWRARNTPRACSRCPTPAGGQLRHLVVLAGPHPDRRHPAAGGQPGAQPGWAAPGSRSARTRTPRKRWVSTPSSSGCGRSPSARPSAVCPGRCMPARCNASRRRRPTSSTPCCSCARWCSAGQGNKLGVILGAFIIDIPAQPAARRGFRGYRHGQPEVICSSGSRWWC